MGQYPGIEEDDFWKTERSYTKKNGNPFLLQIYEKEKEISYLKLENFLSHTIYILIIFFILGIKSLI